MLFIRTKQAAQAYAAKRDSRALTHYLIEARTLTYDPHAREELRTKLHAANPDKRYSDEDIRNLALLSVKHIEAIVEERRKAA